MSSGVQPGQEQVSSSFIASPLIRPSTMLPLRSGIGWSIRIDMLAIVPSSVAPRGASDVRAPGGSFVDSGSVAPQSGSSTGAGDLTSASEAELSYAFQAETRKSALS